MWETFKEAFKEVWPKTFLTTTFLLIIYGLYCGVRIVIKDEKEKRDKKKKKKNN
ncbi:hypothetical protein ES705_11272 [subsurface metagenome]